MVAVAESVAPEDRVNEVTERERLAPLVYRVNEVAELLGVSEWTVYRMANDNALPHLRLGVKGSKKPTMVFPKAALEQWLTDRALADVQK